MVLLCLFVVWLFGWYLAMFWLTRFGFVVSSVWFCGFALFCFVVGLIVLCVFEVVGDLDVVAWWLWCLFDCVDCWLFW